MSTPTWENTEEVTPVNQSIPTWDDTVEVPNKDVSKAESLLRGAAQGLAFDFADELTGGAEALGQAALGSDKFSDLLQNYKKYRNESRQAYEAAQEANPATYITGDVLGSIAPAVVTGGASAVASLGKTGLKQSAKELAKAGIKQGAITGLGASKGDLTEGEIGQAALDTALGGTVGGVVGATLPVAAKGVSKAVGAVKDTLVDTAPKFARRGLEAFNLAEQGIPVVGEKANKQLQSDALTTAQNLLSEFRTQYKRGSEKVGGALTSPENKNVDFSKELQNLEQTLKTSTMLPDDLAKIQRELDQYKDIITKETVEPGLKQAVNKLNEIVTRAKSAGQALGQEVNFTKPEMNYGDNFIESIKTSRNPMGELVSDVTQVAIPEDKVTKETIEQFKTMSLSDLNNVKAQLKDILNNSNIDSKSKGIVSNLVKEVDNAITSNMDDVSKEFYRAGNQEIRDVYKAGDLFKELAPENRFAEDLDIPLAQRLLNAEGLKDETLQRVLGYGSDMGDKLTKEAQQLNTRAGISKALQGEGSMLGGFVNPSSMAVRTGSVLGNVTRKAENVTKPVADFTKNLVKMEDRAISDIASKLKASNDPISQGFGDKLDKILQTDKRDRLLWSISQQPAFRDATNRLLGNDTTDTQN